MKITALRNFIANGVKGSPGYVLTQEESDQVSGIIDDLKKEGLVEVSEGKAAPENLSDAGLVDLGPGAPDNMPDSPADAVQPGDAVSDQAPSDAKQKKKK